MASPAIYRCQDCNKKFRARAARDKAPTCPNCGGEMAVDKRGAAGVSKISNLSSVAGKASSRGSQREIPLDQLGNYEILGKVGEGGMGMVYKARDPQLERFVALKILRSDVMDNPEIVQRFRQEAESIASLKHPFIVNIYDFRHEGDLHYFAMDYVEGRTLEELIISGELTLQEKLEVFTRFLRALGHAHARRVIHRDIKPSNIIIDEDNNPHITDFGLARSLEKPSRLTQEGQSLGTPIYMAPEQLQGGGKGVDHRCDLYSAGVVFYQLLCGQVPYQARTAAELFEQVLSPQPVSLRALGNKIPRQIREIVGQALAKDPEERYQTANSWADDLEPMIDSPRRRQSSRRLDLPARVVAGLCCILLTFGLMTWLVVNEALREPAHAQLVPRDKKNSKKEDDPPRPLPKKDPLDALFEKVKADLNEGRNQAALDTLTGALDRASADNDGAALARLAKRLGPVLTFPLPITAFAPLSPRKTTRLCNAAFSEQPERLAKLAEQLAQHGGGLINQPTTLRQGVGMLQTARYLGFEKPEVFFRLGVGYARLQNYQLALQQIDGFIMRSKQGAKWQGQLLRAQIRLVQGRQLSSQGLTARARAALELAAGDFDRVLKVRRLNYQPPGGPPIRRQYLETLVHLGRNRDAVALLGAFSKMAGQWFNPFTLWGTTAWAQWTSAQKFTIPPTPSYTWRFDRYAVEANAPVVCTGLYLIPATGKYVPREGPSCLIFRHREKSELRLTFELKAPHKLSLELTGFVPMPKAQEKAEITITVNGQTVVSREQLADYGKTATRRWDISGRVRTGENIVRITLTRYAGLVYRLRRVRVFGQ